MTKKILVIEDDNSIRELLAELLETEGYIVRSDANGKEGLQSLKNGFAPDLILVDLMMPIMDGYAFREEQLKKPDWAKIPTIVMSAEAGAKEKLKHYHVTAFLSKPVELDLILNTVALHLKE